MIEYIIILVAIILLIKFILNLRHNRDEFTTDWPIIGMLPGVLHNMSNIHDYTALSLQHHGGTVYFKGPWFTNTNFILTCDPMNVNHILSKNHGNYVKGSNFNEIFEIFGDGIINVNGDEWKYQRKLIHTFVSRKGFVTFFQQTIQNKLKNRLLPFLDHQASKEGSQFDLQDIVRRFMFDTNCNILFGFDSKSLPYNYAELSEGAYDPNALSDMEEVLLFRHFAPPWFWKLLNSLQIGGEKKYSVAKENLERFLYEHIEESRLEAKRRCSNTEEEADESHFDLMNMLTMEGVGEGEKGVNFVRDIVVNLVAAGNSTVNASINWFFWLVSTHPIVEARIIQEIKDNCVVQDENSLTPTVEKLDKLVYLHGAICETLRLYPPLPFEHKCAVKYDILPSGFHVSPNSKICYVSYSMGRMEKVWGKDCMEFKPERWISEKGHVLQVPSYKFIVFNAGPRSCLGKEITFITIKMIAIAILSKFHFDVVEDHSITPLVSIVLNMKYGLKVKVSKRCI